MQFSSTLEENCNTFVYNIENGQTYFKILAVFVFNIQSSASTF